MDQTKLNIMQLRARALAMAIRGHFGAASEGDAEVLEALASHCVRDLDELSHAPATVSVVLVADGDRKIEAIKEVRAFTGMGLKEAKELVEAAPTDVFDGAAREVLAVGQCAADRLISALL